MPNFLEEVLTEPDQVVRPIPSRRWRPRLPSLTNPRAYALVLAGLTALTAIPTCVIMWSGVAELDRGAVPVQPLLPSLTSPEPAPPSGAPPLLIPPPMPRADAGQAQAGTVQEPEEPTDPGTAERQTPERQQVVALSDRPAQPARPARPTDTPPGMAGRPGVDRVPVLRPVLHPVQRPCPPRIRRPAQPSAVRLSS